jgi:hypothetical protein
VWFSAAATEVATRRSVSSPTSQYLVRVFEYAGVVAVVRRWWNGIWGRLARRDIWLIRQTRWLVRARQGDAESGRVLWWHYDTRQQAEAMVERLIQADGSGSWRELPTDTRQPDPTPPENPPEQGR